MKTIRKITEQVTWRDVRAQVLPKIVGKRLRPLRQELHQVFGKPGRAGLTGRPRWTAETLLRLAQVSHSSQEVVGLYKKTGGQKECKQIGPVGVVDVRRHHVLYEGL